MIRILNLMENSLFNDTGDKIFMKIRLVAFTWRC